MENTIPRSSPVDTTLLVLFSESCSYLKVEIEYVTENTIDLLCEGLQWDKFYLLSTQFLGASVRKIFKHQVSVAYMFKACDMLSIASIVWYYIGSNLDKMKEFSSVNFWGHHGILSEYVQFMI